MPLQIFRADESRVAPDGFPAAASFFRHHWSGDFRISLRASEHAKTSLAGNPVGLKVIVARRLEFVTSNSVNYA